MSTPAVSVVLACHRDRGGLASTVKSVLAQNVDLELLLVDDSGCGAVQKGAVFADSRCRWLVNEENLGLTRALNRGLEVAAAPVIARIDEGDLWSAGKLGRQLQCLAENPALIAIGCQYQIALPGNKECNGPDLPLDDPAIRRALAAGRNPFAHPAMLFRNRGLRYNPYFRVAQDFELWSRYAELGRLTNLPDRLLTLNRQVTSISDANVLDQWALPLAASRIWCQYRREVDTVKRQLIAASGLSAHEVEAAMTELLTPAVRRVVPAFIRSSQAGGWRKALGAIFAVILCPRLIAINQERNRQARAILDGAD